jgi:hypothetical protein
MGQRILVPAISRPPVGHLPDARKCRDKNSARPRRRACRSIVFNDRAGRARQRQAVLAWSLIQTPTAPACAEMGVASSPKPRGERPCITTEPPEAQRLRGACLCGSDQMTASDQGDRKPARSPLRPKVPIFFSAGSAPPRLCADADADPDANGGFRDESDLFSLRRGSRGIKSTLSALRPET